MGSVSRRSFLRQGSVGAAGVAAAGGLGLSVVGVNAVADADSGPRPEEISALQQPMVLHIRNAEAGEVGILVGDREIVINDRALVAKIARAIG